MLDRHRGTWRVTSEILYVWNSSTNLERWLYLVPGWLQGSLHEEHAPPGLRAGNIRHDNAGGQNADVIIPGYDTQIYFTSFVDNLGFDSEHVSGVVAWMVECYERGLVARDDLNGFELIWGNPEAICKLLMKIAYREGIGGILAEGLKFAPEKIGKESRKSAMTNKGVAITPTSLEAPWRKLYGLL